MGSVEAVDCSRSTPRSTVYELLPLPLSTKSIRVLQVLPNSAKVSDSQCEIQGSLSVINLDDDPAPKFTALSYVWGVRDPAMPHYVKCGDDSIAITPNCFSALRSLSAKFGNDEFIIWVDAICINQQDGEEKMRQIPMMGDIYAKATATYVWLGEGTSGANRAMKYLSTAGFQQYFKSRTGEIQFRPWRAAFSATFSRYSLTSHPFPYTMDNGRYPIGIRSFWVTWTRIKPIFLLLGLASFVNYVTTEDLEELLSRNWVDRVWTYQEILLSTHPVVVCGKRHIEWSRFAQSITFLGPIRLPRHTNVEVWWSIVVSRLTLHDSDADSSHSASFADLEKYADFCTRFAKSYGSVAYRFALVLMVPFLGVIVYVPFLAREILKRGTVNFVFFILAGFFSLGFVAWNLFFSPVTRYKVKIGAPLMKRKNLSQDSLLIGLYGRKATEPRDMAIGMWGVLQNIGSPVPVPRAEEGTGYAYQLFARRLIESSGTLSTLLIAAARRYPDQPSWVPDWSAYGDHGWGPYIESRFRSAQGNHSAVTWRNPFAFSDDGTILCVSTHPDPPRTITDVEQFETTSEEYKADAIAAQRRNLRYLHTYRKGIAKHLPRDSKDDSHYVTASEIHHWLGFFTETGAWQMHRREKRMHFKRVFHSSQRTFRIQAKICNALAAQNRLVCKTENGFFSICSASAKPGDLILDVIGVDALLIVRRIADDGNDVKIVGLAEPSPMGYWTSSPWATRKAWKPGQPTIEYYIH